VQSVVRVVFHERRLQYVEKEQLDVWKLTRPGERIVDIGQVYQRCINGHLLCSVVCEPSVTCDSTVSESVADMSVIVC